MRPKHERGSKLVGLPLLPGTLVMAALLAGCASYYRVTDPVTNRTYYTKDYDRTESGGVSFRDGRTGAKVTLQTSEIAEVTKQEYRSKTGARGY